MKRISFLLVTLALCAAPAVRAQDAATQERLDKLSGRIDDLTAGQEALKKQLNDLSKDLENLREQSSKPNTSYASQDDLNRLLEQIKTWIEADGRCGEDSLGTAEVARFAQGAASLAETESHCPAEGVCPLPNRRPRIKRSSPT